ncbi:alpha/beta hydrolase [Candidatus Nitronereus thalassa]|uniref:Alpha/beta hydrolase n=2 Tax=Candidatus Nitronereus thalassa TaxID=3020898 RepID=A0ABU3K6Z9_9BACT|nr:alpha/beta hydrolase [Candidatus Nitronereus thalassa]
MIFLLAFFLGVSPSFAETNCFLSQDTSHHSDRTPKRIYVRDNPRNRSLLLFVHGFNSTNRSAWTQLVSLLCSDPEMKGHNILLFGYPTELWDSKNDIPQTGRYLAAELKLFADTKRYSNILPVGHSMGGLVIVGAVLHLISEDQEYVLHPIKKILTYGTPHFGVPEANWVSILNVQIADMELASNVITRFLREWVTRVIIKCYESAGLDRCISLHAHAGIGDELVPEWSACGVFPCENVDGTHSKIIRPGKNVKHHSFTKIKQHAQEQLYANTILIYPHASPNADQTSLSYVLLHHLDAAIRSELQTICSDQGIKDSDCLSGTQSKANVRVDSNNLPTLDPQYLLGLQRLHGAIELIFGLGSSGKGNNIKFNSRIFLGEYKGLLNDPYVSVQVELRDFQDDIQEIRRTYLKTTLYALGVREYGFNEPIFAEHFFRRAGQYKMNQNCPKNNNNQNIDDAICSYIHNIENTPSN